MEFVFLILLIPLIAVILDSQLGRALAKRLERSAPPAIDAGRVEALEAEIERLGRQVAELEEQGEFLQRLLTERPHEPGALPPPHGTDAGEGRAAGEERQDPPPREQPPTPSSGAS